MFFLPLTLSASTPPQNGTDKAQQSELIYISGNTQIVGAEYISRKISSFSAAQFCAVAEFSFKSNYYLI